MARKITASIIPARLDDFVKQLEAAQLDVKENIEDVVMTAANEMQNTINETLRLHKVSGETERHAIKPVGRWELDNFIVNVGVELSGNLQDMKEGEGGYAVLLLEYGTPRKHKAGEHGNSARKSRVGMRKHTRFIGNAVRRNKKHLHYIVQKRYNEIFGRGGN